ncbi:MAG TPA: hypothetical protein VIM10_14180 [Actinopolymorphaceae bacterium]|jgi:hypothetical protein
MTRALLDGDEAGMQLLATLYTDDPAVRRDGDEYYLHAQVFEDGLTDHTYADIAESLIQVMNGIARLQLQGLMLPRLTGDWDEFPEDYVPNSRVRLEGLSASAVNAEALSPKEARYALALAAQRTDVALVLGFLATPDDWDITWFDLAKVYEILRDDMGNKSFAKSWPEHPEDAQSAFAVSANRFSVSGKAARHAPHKTNPAKHMMSKGEAKSILYPMVREWLKGLELKA